MKRLRRSLPINSDDSFTRPIAFTFRVHVLLDRRELSSRACTRAREEQRETGHKDTTIRICKSFIDVLTETDSSNLKKYDI